MTEETIFYWRLRQEIKKCGKSANQIERELGWPRNALHNYKNGTEPSGIRLIELAEYFNVSPQFLIGKTEVACVKSPEDLFEQLSEFQKFEILKVSNNWAENLIKNYTIFG